MFAGDAGGNLVAYDAVTGTPVWHTHIGYVSNPPTTYFSMASSPCLWLRATHYMRSGSTNKGQGTRGKGQGWRFPIEPLALVVALCTCAGSYGTLAANRAEAPATTVLYVSNETAGTVAILDGSTGAVEAKSGREAPARCEALARWIEALCRALRLADRRSRVDESKLPPADRSADGIGMVDLASRKLERVYPSGPDPEAFDLSPDGKTLYVSNEDTSAMAVVDVEKGAVTKSVSICGEPEGVTVAPDGRTVYVTCEADGAVAAIDTTSFKVIAQIPTAPRPRGIVFSSDGNTIFVTCENGAALSSSMPRRTALLARWQ